MAQAIQTKSTSPNHASQLFLVHGDWHKPMLVLFMVLVLFHFSEPIPLILPTVVTLYVYFKEQGDILPDILPRRAQLSWR